MALNRLSLSDVADRLQKKEVSKDTLAAVSTFSEMLATLTAKYKAFEEDKD